MSEKAPIERRFSEEQVSTILRLAAEHEIRPQQARGGLTLSEVVAIGREVGLDPAQLERAAAVTTTPPGTLAKLVLGRGTRFVTRARFGRRVHRGRYRELTELLERAFARAGVTDESDTTYRWHEDHGPGRTTVEVRWREGASDVLVEADRQGWALLTGLGSVAAGLVALPLLAVVEIGTTLGPVAAVLAPLLIGGLLTRTVYPRLTRGLAHRVERAALGVLGLADDGNEAPPLPRPSDRALPRGTEPPVSP